MQPKIRPLVDEKNPFYCPAIPASDYLRSLREQQQNGIPGPIRNGSTRSTRHERDRFMQSFTRLIANTVYGNERSSDDGHVNFIVHSAADPCPVHSSGSSEGTLAYPIPSWELEESPTNFGNNWIQKRGYPRPVKKRKRLSYSDIRNPAEYARSFQSLHESSFDVSVKREKLVYLTPENSGRHLPLKLCHSPSSGRNDIKMNTTAQRLQLRISDLEGLHGSFFGALI
ncbi:hypothetical protein BD779DRAFT_600233 [Infundibulicybe gibba]|nr:hypothetical protein BD779DRAFT_600233 [Infundibulicybe gibba]